MTRRAVLRLKDIKEAISDVRLLLAGTSIQTLRDHRPTRAAFERFLEILSEASRHIPDEWKADFPQIPWRQIADLGNFLRHGYDKVNLEELWSIYENDLEALEHAIDTLLERHDRNESEH
jgi:uncharacterized protein with HEPN domain